MMKAKCKNGGMGEIGDAKGIMEDDGNGGKGIWGEFLERVVNFWGICCTFG